jgi:hypothetical protein
MVNAEGSKNRVNSSTQLLCIVAPGQIPELSSTLVFSEETSPLTTVVFKSLNQVASKRPETNAVLERMTMLFQWETVTAQNGQKVQLLIPSLILLSMSIFGSEIFPEPGGSLPRMAKKISNGSA